MAKNRKSDEHITVFVHAAALGSVAHKCGCNKNVLKCVKFCLIFLFFTFNRSSEHELCNTLSLEQISLQLETQIIIQWAENFHIFMHATVAQKKFSPFLTINYGVSVRTSYVRVATKH